MSAPQPSNTKNAIARVIAHGQDREAIELRYELARAEFIEASLELGRFGALYGRLVSVVPDSIDLRLYPETKREPVVPRLVTAGEVRSWEER